MSDLDLTNKDALVATAVKTILDAMGMNINSPDLVDTPRRVAKMFLNDFVQKEEERPEMTCFPVENIRVDMVIIKDLEVRSMCAHHLLPFFGKATIVYLPSNTKLGLSKFQRVIDWLAKEPQDQETLTDTICSFLASSENLLPNGVFVKIECLHTCMVMRGVKNMNSTTITYAGYGVYSEHNISGMFYKLLEITK